jgi:hypothetical protein
MPGGAASGQAVSPTAAATPYTQMLRQLHAQADKLLAAEAATAEVIKGLDCIAVAMAAAAEERAALCAQHKFVLAALESQAQIGPVAPVEASRVPMSQLARSAAVVASAAARRRLDGAMPDSASAPQRVAQQAVAEVGQAAAVATAASVRPFPTLGQIRSMEELWTLYTVGDQRRDQVALRLLEASGTAWRKAGPGKKSWRSRWHEIMVLISAIRARTEAWGLGDGNEAVAARRIDAEERVEGGKTLSLDALMRKLKAAKKAAGDAEGR